MQVLPNGLVEHRTPAEFPVGSPAVMAALLAAASTRNDRVALIDGDQSWTFVELLDAVHQAAAALDATAPVIVRGSNSADLIIEVFAGLSIGAAIFFNPPPSVDCQQLMTLLGNHRVVGFTSGTGGEPKAVVHSERNLLLPGSVSLDLEPPADDERIGTALSLPILNVMVLGPLSALIRQTTFVVIDQTSPATDGIIDGINEHSVTRLFAVPTQIHDLAIHTPESVSLRSLDRVILGGAGASAGTLSSFTERFGVRPTLSYGMTEAPTGVVRESTNDPIGSGRGFPLAHVEVRIFDGEICLSPATSGRWANTWTPTYGYLGDPDRTAALFEGGVLHTGDRGALDDDGALSVTGRLSSMIIRGGMNVDPVAVESVLLEDPSVAEAVVCGFPDERLGEKVGAVVVAAPGETVDRNKLRALVAERLNSHSAPDAVLEWEELPRGSLGKVAAIDPTLFTTAPTTDLT